MFCKNCGNKIEKNSKFCVNCGEKVLSADTEKIEESNSNFTLADAMMWQQNIKKDLDLNKPDNELSPEELANKAIYNALDDTLKENLGEEKKKEIDNLRDRAEFTAETDKNVKSLIELGKEVEKNLILQRSYLIIYFDKGEENHFKVTVNNMTDKMLKDESLKNNDRVDLANQILKLISSYGDKIIKELTTREEIVDSLLKKCKEKIKGINFAKWKEEINKDEVALDEIGDMFLKWIKLTEELFISRKKAVESVKENLEMEEIVPNLVIKNNGDITKTGGKEILFKGDRMLKLINEATESETEIEKQRDIISEWLFGKVEDYMEFPKERENETKTVTTDNESIWSKWWVWVIIIFIIYLLIN